VRDTTATQNRPGRRTVLVSLALNVFLLGLLGALAFDRYVAQSSAGRSGGSRTPAARIERLAVLLPSADAEQLRVEFHERELRIEPLWLAYRDAREAIAGALRVEPFDADALRAAMTRTRATRMALEQGLQEVVAAAAAKMSPAGRDKLADRACGRLRASRATIVESLRGRVTANHRFLLKLHFEQVK